MGMQKALAACFVSLLFGGCTPKAIPPHVIAAADYGALPPPDHQALTMGHIGGRLIDPLSAVYEFQPPKKGYTRPTFLFPQIPQHFGWLVCGHVNAKNRLGGYVGRVPFYVLFRNGQIVSALVGKITDNEYGLNFQNSYIYQVCA